MDVLMMMMEIAGTIAFAISGAVTGLKKNMDIFGISILGLTTAVGGGIIRDLLVGITPPITFRDPIYALTAIATSIIVFLPSVRRVVLSNGKLSSRLLLLTDSLGLAVFTVSGVQVAFSVSQSYDVFLLVFLGTVTGVGGGVMRDIMAGNTPYIFIKHIYACAAILGALLCALLWRAVGSGYAMLIGLCAIFVLRLLSAHFRWSLPKAHMLPQETAAEEKKQNPPA